MYWIWIEYNLNIIWIWISNQNIMKCKNMQTTRQSQANPKPGDVTYPAGWKIIDFRTCNALAVSSRTLLHVGLKSPGGNFPPPFCLDWPGSRGSDFSLAAPRLHPLNKNRLKPENIMNISWTYEHHNNIIITSCEHFKIFSKSCQKYIQNIFMFFKIIW